jgi:hypothetical protein
MRKHPLLAFVTAVITCSIPATISVAWADTTPTPPSPLGTVGAPTAPTTARSAAEAHRARALLRRERAQIRARVKARIAVAHPYIALGGVWLSLRSCESHDNYTTNTGNGFYGAYQFSLESWRGIGQSGLPSAASPQVQDAAARVLFARQGWRAWPTCSWKIGVA